jgi:hypothetical protein
MLERQKNPWVIAAAIAVAFMFLDDLPEPGYNTFHDPGAAAMLSIIVADAIAALVNRGRIGAAMLIFLPAFFLKFFLQPLFWVHDAWFWDISTLLAVHFVIAFFALRGLGFEDRVLCSVASVIGICLALAALTLISAAGSSWIHFYFEVGIARILIPFAFWTLLLLCRSVFCTRIG